LHATEIKKMLCTTNQQVKRHVQKIQVGKMKCSGGRTTEIE